MMKQIILALTCAVLLAGCTQTVEPAQNSNFTALEIQTAQGTKQLQVELAVTSEQQHTGLMFRESMPADQGMLFIFRNSAVQSFWMKDTKIPLDMIFIDHTGKIVSISENSQPCVTDVCTIYWSEGPAQYVLEVNADKSKEWGLKKTQQLMDTNQLEN